MRKSVVVALVLMLIAALWIGSGFLGDSGPSRSVKDMPTVSGGSVPSPSVQVETLRAASVAQVLYLMGVTAPRRQVQVPAQTKGAIAALTVETGARVDEGQLLARIQIGDRKARLREAQALLVQREAEHQAATQLSKKNLQSATELTRTQTLLDSARASLEAIRLDINRTKVVAPFAGVVEQRFVQIGDYLDIGHSVFKLLDLSKLKVKGQIAEREVSRVRLGMPADLTLVDGQRLRGEVTFISRASDSATRTFLVEVTADNPDLSISAGMTAKIRLNLGDRRGHRLSPAVLTLDDQGRVGVKIIDENATVRFVPVELIADSPEGMWLGGLPETVELITVGHEFVSTGQRVTVSRSVK
tara:strand:- start:1100 stop:2173 length:1074 start_codon:yes stop_codon:yes gene_type:complete